MKSEHAPIETSKVYAVGETVFDIIFKDFHPQAAKPGGSAFNAMISLGRLGVTGQFISEVGNDKIGNHILDFLKENRVGSDYMIRYEDGKSALSLAFLNNSSDAEYDFYKDYPSQRLNEDLPVFNPSDYLLFGSFYGLNPVLRPQIESILYAAGSSAALVYYDPNFRSSHVDDLEQLREIIEKNFRASDIVRASDEDLRNIYGIKDSESAWKKVSHFTDYFVYTANAHGVELYTPRIRLHIDVDPIEPLSTIGAGDTFNAGIIYGLYKRRIGKEDLPDLDEKTWQDILQTAALFSKEVCLSFENYIPINIAAKYAL